MDCCRQFARITLKTMPRRGFDHSPVWANLRNVSRLGSHSNVISILYFAADPNFTRYRFVQWDGTKCTPAITAAPGETSTRFQKRARHCALVSPRNSLIRFSVAQRAWIGRFDLIDAEIVPGCCE